MEADTALEPVTDFGLTDDRLTSVYGLNRLPGRGVNSVTGATPGPIAA